MISISSVHALSIRFTVVADCQGSKASFNRIEIIDVCSRWKTFQYFLFIYLFIFSTVTGYLPFRVWSDGRSDTQSPLADLTQVEFCPGVLERLYSHDCRESLSGGNRVHGLKECLAFGYKALHCCYALVQ
jgi:hypothetical protein